MRPLNELPYNRTGCGRPTQLELGKEGLLMRRQQTYASFLLGNSCEYKKGKESNYETILGKQRDSLAPIS